MASSLLQSKLFGAKRNELFVKMPLFIIKSGQIVRLRHPKVEKVEEVEEIEKVEEVEEMETVEEVEKVQEVVKVQEVEWADEVEWVEEVELVNEIEKVEKQKPLVDGTFLATITE